MHLHHTNSRASESALHGVGDRILYFERILQVTVMIRQVWEASFEIFPEILLHDEILPFPCHILSACYLGINQWLTFLGTIGLIYDCSKRVFICINKDLPATMLELKEGRHLFQPWCQPVGQCVRGWWWWWGALSALFKLHLADDSLLQNSHSPVEYVSDWQSFLPMLLDLECESGWNVNSTHLGKSSSFLWIDWHGVEDTGDRPGAGAVHTLSDPKIHILTGLFWRVLALFGYIMSYSFILSIHVW